MGDNHIDLRSRTGDVMVDAGPVTALDQLAAELAPPVTKTVTLLVDTRPGWSVTYALDLDGPRLAGWRRAARDDTLGENATDEYLWQRTILAAQARQLRFDGIPVVDDAGKPVTFFSPKLWQMVHVPAGSPSGSTEAVRKFFVNDFHATAHADRLIAEAGFGRAARTAPDPTSGSSSS